MLSTDGSDILNTGHELEDAYAKLLTEYEHRCNMVIDLIYEKDKLKAEIEHLKNTLENVRAELRVEKGRRGRVA